MTSAVRDLVIRFRGDTSDVEDSASGLSKTLGAAGLASGVAFAAAAVGAMNVEAANDKLAAQLGATGQRAKDLGKVAGDLYSNAYGDSLEQVNEAIRGVVQSGLVMEDASKAQLESVTAKVLDLSTAFDQDLGGATEAVGQLMKTGLAPNAEAALDVVTRGFQEGADRSGDFLDTLTEYSGQFQKFGLDAGTATGILVQGMDAGARNSDLVADAIKEFSIRAIDGSKLTTEGFSAIGLSADDMRTKIAAGGPAAAEALDVTLDRLRGIQDPAQRSAAAVALFGTQAEDLGDALFALDPSEAVKGLGNVAGATERMGETLNDNATTNLTSFKRQVEQAFVQILGGKVLPIVNDVSAVLATYFGPTLNLLGDILKGVARFVDEFKFELGLLVAVLGFATIALNLQAIAVGAYLIVLKAVTIATRAWAVIQGVLNAVMAANPVTLVVLAIVALVAAIVIAYRRSDEFRAIVQATWQGIQAAALYAWENILKPTFAALVTAYHAVADAALWLWHNVITPAWEGISKAIEVAQVAIGIYIDAVKLYFTVMADVVMWLWNNIITPAWAGISKAIEIAKTAIGVYIDAVKLYFQLMGEAAMFLWNWAIKPAWDGIMLVIDGAKIAIGTYIDAIKLYFTAMGDTIMFVWNQVISPAFELLKTGVRTVQTTFGEVVAGIETVWNRLSDILKKPIVFFIDTIWNKGVGGAWGIMDGFLAGVLPDFKEVPLPPGFAKGGKVPGSGSKDTVPAMLTPGEIVVRKQIAEPYKNFLLAFNSGQAEALQAAGGRGARGPQRFAAGGLVAGEQFARAQHGKPYIWGGVGPRGYDCSGFMSAIANALMGRNPHSRLGTTGSAPWSGWTQGLTSAFGVGFFKGNPGHMAGTLNGFNVESGGSPSRTKFVQQAAGARHSQFRGHMSLPQVGGMFTGGGGGGGGGSGFFDYLGAITGALNPVRALIDPWLNANFPGSGPIKDMFRKLPNMVIDGVFEFVKDKAQAVFGVGADLFKGAVGGIAGVLGDASVRQQVAMVSSKRRWNFGANWDALDWLIAKESSWNPRAQNPRSTAYGLYQFLDATWGSVGGHKTSDPKLQAEFGNRYIAQRYGDPIGAKAFHQRNNWYDTGGRIPPGLKLIYNGTGSDEWVLNPAQAERVSDMALAGGQQIVVNKHYHLTVHEADNNRVDLETQFKRLELAAS